MSVSQWENLTGRLKKGEPKNRKDKIGQPQEARAHQQAGHRGQPNCRAFE